MNILVVHCRYRYKGGEEKVVDEEVNLLRQAGHQVELLTFSNEGNVFLKILQFPFNLASYLLIKKVIRKFSPNVLHVHNLHFAASPSVLYAARHCGIPIVYTLHNFRLLCPSGSLFFNQQTFLFSLNGKFPWKAIQKGVYRKSRLLTFWFAFSMQLHHWLGTWRFPSRYIMLTDHAKKIFVQSRLGVQEERFVVKPNFCSPSEREVHQRNNDFLFVGRLSVEKGARLLMNVFSSLPFQITIAGDGDLKDEVIAFAKKYNNITYAGSLKKDELVPLMKKSSALIFPSIWYEGMPLTIIEAFANGLPVIATKLGAMECMVTPNRDGLLFEGGNENELKATLSHWSALSKQEKESYSVQALMTYERHYTPEINAAQLLAVYDRVQAAKQQPSLIFD